MNSKEIGNWCVENKAVIAKIIMKYDRYPDNFQDNFNHLTFRLMERGVKYQPTKGRKFSTYAYTILVREMIEYLNWKTSKLSYPHMNLTVNKYNQKRIELEKGSYSFGAIPDFIEAKAGAKDLSDIELNLDSEALKKKLNNIINYALTPTQKALFKYRYNDDFEIAHTFQECSDMFGYTTTRAAQLERKVINKVRDYLKLNPLKKDERLSKSSVKQRKMQIEKEKENNIW